MYYDPEIKEKLQNQNYATNKTKKVAWLISNCAAHNDRLIYGHELQKYIQVCALLYTDCISFNLI